MMDRKFRVAGAVYNGSLWAMLASLAVFRVTYIEMMLNTGFVFFGLWAAFALILFFWKRLGGLFGLKGTVINLIVCAGLAVALIGAARLSSVPAAIIREGLKQPRMPFAQLNCAVSAFLIVGLFFTKRGKIQQEVK
ncbi:hypothetical protein AGMMS49957_04990 [Synergistales bacterium]|nr:hypothetical protein AGMMS49957_04990 [Synergistales bacterium]